MEYTRICPKCKKTLYHTTKYLRNAAQKANRLCRSCKRKEVMAAMSPEMRSKAFVGFSWVNGKPNPFKGCHHTEETKQLLSKKNTGHKVSQQTKRKLSAANSGNQNPMAGRTFYDVWVEKYGKEEADRLFELKRDRNRAASSGKNNPMFGKPAPRGSGGGWSGWYNDWFFRSLRELAFAVGLDKNCTKWTSGEFVKIEYSFNGVLRTYRPDFVVGNTIIEIKPKALIKSSDVVKAKYEAAMAWCQQNGFKYQIQDIALLPLDELTVLYQKGTVQFTKKYEKRFLEDYKKDQVCKS